MLGKIVWIFNYCKLTSTPVPSILVLKQLTDAQSFKSTLAHMEDMRLMYIKISQIDYFIWLTRVQKIAKDKDDQESLTMIQDFNTNTSILCIKEDKQYME